MSHSIAKTNLLLLVVLAAGCTTTGTGFASLTGGTLPVNFSWKSSDRVSGSLSATVADGTTYTGNYLQITSETTVDSLGSAWGPGPWAGPVWGGEEFATHYTGRVVADLASPNGAHLRCAFLLVHPSAGMAGGGGGLCQAPGGNVIDVTLRRS
jgi:hypothetical protein